MKEFAISKQCWPLLCDTFFHLFGVNCYWIQSSYKFVVSKLFRFLSFINI